MDDWHDKRLTDDESTEFFGRLFPHGFAGEDVIPEIAPEGWEHSRLLACFHPSPERVLKERREQHRHLEELLKVFPKHKSGAPKTQPQPEPKMEQVLAEWKAQPVNLTEEVTELVAGCLCDVFSDNHEVVVADGRLVDVGSFRAASAFLEGYLTGRTGEGYLGGGSRRPCAVRQRSMGRAPSPRGGGHKAIAGDRSDWDWMTAHTSTR